MEYQIPLARGLSELPAEAADAIEASKMNPAHDHLNDLLKEQE
jgi:hypothetical protein